MWFIFGLISGALLIIMFLCILSAGIIRKSSEQSVKHESDVICLSCKYSKNDTYDTMNSNCARCFKDGAGAGYEERNQNAN